MRLGLLSCLLFLGMAKAEQLNSLPNTEEIHAQIQLLGDEQYRLRKEASAQLNKWAALYPRYVLTHLAEVYPQQSDPEVVYRIEGVLRQLAKETLFYVPKGFLGINFEYYRERGPSPAYIAVLMVVEGSAAESAGLRDGDRILKVDGRDVNTYKSDISFAEQVQKKLPLEYIPLRVQRGDKVFDVEVQLGLRPMQPNLFARYVAEEDAKIEQWLKTLRKQSDYKLNEPVGSFELQQD